jgi:hypothetical protein
MLQFETTASAAISVMLLACVLGAGFMIRFLVALIRDERKVRVECAHRHAKPHDPANMAWVDAPCRKTAVNSAAHLAIGVVRITTALASDAGRRKSLVSVDRLHVVTLDTPGQEVDFTAVRRYRSG